MNKQPNKARRPRFFTYLCCPLLVNGLMLSALADRVDLVNGAFVDGKIVEETALGVRIEYNTTATIKDTRFIPKAEIKKVTKEGPDQVEYRELFKLFPLPDFLKNDDYATLIDRKLKPFLAKYPSSKHLSDVQLLIGTAEAERAKVTAGSLKVNAKWITPQEYEKDKYNYDALMLLSQMKRLGTEGNYNGAMRVFDKISSDHGVSAHFPAAVAEAKNILVSFDKTVKQLLKEAPLLISRREKGLAGITDLAEKSKVTDAVKKEIAELTATRAEEKTAGYRWLTYHKYDLASLDETTKLIKELDQSLSQYNPETFARYSLVVRDAMRAIKERRPDEVARLAKLAQDAGAPKEMMERLTKEAELLKVEAQKGSGTPVTPVPFNPPPPPVPAPAKTEPDMADILKESGNPLQRSMAKQQEEADAARAAAASKSPVAPNPGAANNPPAAGSVMPTIPVTGTPVVPPAAPVAVTPPPPATAPAPAAATTPPVVSPALVAEEDSAISPLLIGGVGAAVLLVGLLIYSKRRSKLKDDDAEEAAPVGEAASAEEVESAPKE